MEVAQQTKTYSKVQVDLSKIAKAMAHPARVAILELLNKKSCTCNDIVSELPLAQSTVSQHLKELKKVNLIDGSNKPPKTIYTINKKSYTRTKKALNNFFEKS